jgi:hypothetical protein
MREVERLYKNERRDKDAYYSKRDKKNDIRNNGGTMKSGSPVWDDDD